MKIALLYNHSSGRRMPLGSVRDMLVREGHELVRIVESHDRTPHLADAPAEVVVAAGGDGTVSAAARAVVGRDVPIAILPLGTANNIAFSLGAHGPLETLARLWHRARRVPIDLGVARGSWGTQRFVEGVGGGLVASAIASMTARPAPAGEPAPWQLTRALRRYADLLAALRPEPWTITLDGQPASGDYLLVEILNMRSVGPNLALAPDANPSDGVLDVVTVGEQERDALARGLEDLREGRDTVLSLPRRRARRVDVQCPCDIHVDDQLVRDRAAIGMSIAVEQGAVTILDTRP